MSSASITSVSARTSKSPLAVCKTTRIGWSSSRRCCAAASHPKRPARLQAATICGSSMLRSVDTFMRQQQVKTATHASQVHSVHLSHRIASAGRGAGRYDAVDFSEIVCREHNVRGAHILLEVLARFRARYRYDEDPCTRALRHWPSDGELGERGVLSARDGLKRRAQSEVFLDIGAVKARQLRANVVRCHFLSLGYLVDQHP